jgi:hypothetical protein
MNIMTELPTLLRHLNSVAIGWNIYAFLWLVSALDAKPTTSRTSGAPGAKSSSEGT